MNTSVRPSHSEQPGQQQSLFCDNPSNEIGVDLDPQLGVELGGELGGELRAELRGELRGELGVEVRGNPRAAQESTDHLQAAQFLAKKLRSRRARPNQRKHAGIAICRHLIALLDNEAPSQSKSTTQ